MWCISGYVQLRAIVLDARTPYLARVAQLERRGAFLFRRRWPLAGGRQPTSAGRLAKQNTSYTSKALVYFISTSVYKIIFGVISASAGPAANCTPFTTYGACDVTHVNLVFNIELYQQINVSMRLKDS